MPLRVNGVELQPPPPQLKRRRKKQGGPHLALVSRVPETSLSNIQRLNERKEIDVGRSKACGRG